MNKIFLIIAMLLFSFEDCLAANFELQAKDVEAAISEALAKANATENPRAMITSNRKIILFSDKEPVEVEINELFHNPDDKSWKANMILIRDGDVVSARPIAGKYETQKAIPVLNKRINKGQVITKEDLGVRYVADYKVQPTIINDESKIIGMSPERTISPDRPIRVQELTKPTIVQKGANVQMIFETPNVNIQTVGEALDDGGMGDVIRVRNHDSNNIVRAKIISNNQVMAGSL
jgi:flagellar basal body P-ring formation protein FlgA